MLNWKWNGETPQFNFRVTDEVYLTCISYKWHIHDVFQKQPKHDDVVLSVRPSQSCPTLDLSNWDPEPPAGLEFLSVQRNDSGYHVPDPQHQHQLVGKIRGHVSRHGRKQRQRDFLSVKTPGREIYGMVKYGQCAVSILLRQLDMLQSQKRRSASGGNVGRCGYIPRGR